MRVVLLYAEEATSDENPGDPKRSASMARPIQAEGHPGGPAGIQARSRENKMMESRSDQRIDTRSALLLLCENTRISKEVTMERSFYVNNHSHQQPSN